MLLTITYRGHNTTDLGYLLYKNPTRPQAVELSHGNAYVFYPELSDTLTTVGLLLDVDPIGLVRGKSHNAGLFDYVNDRPYVSSSLLSTAISRVFGTAMSGRGDDHQELADSNLDLTAAVTMLPCGRNPAKLNAVFEPLGYKVRYDTFVLDEHFPGWGQSQYVNLEIAGQQRLRDLLRHLVVLIPVFDNKKHYWVNTDEVDKLLRLAQDWLSDHPERNFITDRYLKRQRSLVNLAFDRLATANAVDGEVLTTIDDLDEPELKPPPLNAQRLDTVAATLKDLGARSVIDLGCGEGRLLAQLVPDQQFTRLTGMDVSMQALRRASGRLHLDDASESMRQRVQLFQGSLTYRDRRFEGYDAACLVEVIEHLDIPRLSGLAKVVFGYAKPRIVVITTPNYEFNQHWEHLDHDQLRHHDHRFEWTRAQFQQWAKTCADQFGYGVTFASIGDVDPDCGSPTQMAVFIRCE